MLKAIIFDLDNTLLDFMTQKRIAVAGAITAMRDAGLEIDHFEAEKKLFDMYEEYGIEYQKIFQKFLREVLGKVDYKILANAIVGYRRAQSGAMRTYPQVKSTLIKLKEKGLKLAVLTDAPRMRGYIRLAETGLLDFFDHIVTYTDTKKYKPDPKPFEVMLKKLSIEPKQTLMVGDSLDKDVLGAKKIGMYTCHSLYGEVNSKNKRIKPHYQLHNISELLPIVDELNNH